MYNFATLLHGQGCSFKQKMKNLRTSQDSAGHIDDREDDPHADPDDPKSRHSISKISEGKSKTEIASTTSARSSAEADYQIAGCAAGCREPAAGRQPPVRPISLRDRATHFPPRASLGQVEARGFSPGFQQKLRPTSRPAKAPEPRPAPSPRPRLTARTKAAHPPRRFPSACPE